VAGVFGGCNLRQRPVSVPSLARRPDATRVKCDIERRAARRNPRSRCQDQEGCRRLDVSEDKRDAIYGRLAGLAKEVDRSKTFYGTLMSLILETSGTLGEAAEKLDPLARLMRRLTSIIADQKTADEQSQLPAPPERKRIEGPGPRQQRDLDDELPF